MKMDIRYSEPPPDDDRYSPCRLKVEMQINFAEEVDKAIAALTVLKGTLPPEKEPG